MSAKQEAFRIFMSMRTEICLLHDSELLKDKIAKQCALIAMDEILKQCWDYRDIDLQASYDYWQEVKHEIQLL
jgi:hypothetical protein